MMKLFYFGVLMISFPSHIHCDYKTACSEELTALGCKCRVIHPAEYHVDCSNQGLIQIPVAIPRNVTNLCVSNNDISNVKSNDLPQMRTLKELDLSDNLIARIEDNAFTDLSAIEILLLSNNHINVSTLGRPISKIPNKTLKHLDIRWNLPLYMTSDGNLASVWQQTPLLTSLHMDGLRAGFDDSFTNLTNLEVISFHNSNCRIYDIKEDYFMGLRKSPIWQLDLNGCRVIHFNGSSFKHLNNLTWLSVANNDLHSTIASMASGLKQTQIRHLDLNNTGIEHKAGNLFTYHLCNLHNLYFLSVAGNRIGDTPIFKNDCFKKLELLSIANNAFSLYSIDADALLSLPSLRFLNVSYLNHLGRYNSATYVSPDSNRGRRSVDGSYFSDSSYDTHSETNVFGGGPLHKVHVAKSAGIGSFTPVDNLTNGHLPGMFRRSSSTRYPYDYPPDNVNLCVKGFGCPVSLPLNVEVLDFSYGLTIGYFPEIILTSDTRLTAIIWRGLGMTSVNGPFHCRYKKLYIEYIDFSDNKINDMPQNFFKLCDWTSLKRLYMKYNPIGNVLDALGAHPFFHYLTGLEELDFGSIQLSKLHPDIFKSNTHLQYLCLSGNLLKDFEADISNLLELQYLDLSFNRISYLSYGARSNLNAVLRHSSLKVNLQGNPLTCSCGDAQTSIEWMYRNRDIFDHLETYTCTMPDGQVLTFGHFEYLRRHLDGHCSSMLWLQAPSVASIMVAVVTVISSFLYRIRFSLSIMNNRRRRETRAVNGDIELAPEFLFDAFVGFHMNDSRWIEDEMSRNLEPPGRGMRTLRPEEAQVPVSTDSPFLRLSLHHRDFRIGYPITDNIFDSIYYSRTTVMVVSNSAVQRYWWHYELRLAIEKAEQQQDNSLLFVFLEPIHGHLMTPLLRHIFLTYNCERWWPHDRVKQMNLWRKLRYAIKYPK